MIYRVDKKVSYLFNAYVEADSLEEAKRMAYDGEIDDWEEESEDADVEIGYFCVPYDGDRRIETMEELNNAEYVDWVEAEE